MKITAQNYEQRKSALYASLKTIQSPAALSDSFAELALNLVPFERRTSKTTALEYFQYHIDEASCKNLYNAITRRVRFTELTENPSLKQWLYLAGELSYHGIGTDRDKQRAGALFLESAKLGYAPAQHSLGYHLLYDTDSTEHIEAALLLLTMAATQGHVLAQNDLGWCYRHNRNITPDKEASAYWFEQAARQDHQIALACIGGYYHRGEGVPKDLIKAINYTARAVEVGHKYMSDDLKKMKEELAERLSNNATITATIAEQPYYRQNKAPITALLSAFQEAHKIDPHCLSDGNLQKFTATLTRVITDHQKPDGSIDAADHGKMIALLRESQAFHVPQRDWEIEQKSGKWAAAIDPHLIPDLAAITLEYLEVPRQQAQRLCAPKQASSDAASASPSHVARLQSSPRASMSR